MKIEARNYFLRILTNSHWRAFLHTLTPAVLAMCYSTAEYANSAWQRSKHDEHIDTALNESCRLTTDPLKPFNIEKVCVIAGIASSSVRREVAAKAHYKVEFGYRHMLYNKTEPARRLKSTQSFMATC